MQGMYAHLAVRTGEKLVAMGSQPEGGAGVDSDRELMLEDARSISQGLWRMVRLAQDAAESPDRRIEEEDLNGIEEAVEVRAALACLQALSVEISENLTPTSSCTPANGEHPADQRSPESVLPERMDSVRYTLPYRANGLATP